ncbi:carbamoyl-phosphate synthase large subunit [uncultured Peptoniphilus sp.]|uniref:carbamoyl-phosphate synthase large subunit n=1 Tax=uncultured Peptoniphilus sp. TaxID=254354 RepID=UPI0028056D62|nr:carbamoyl-phosphate synthase large subunit [uncultured Peptoniphilus sp.]
MPKKSIKKTLVIGSGPIVIGQAAEFDYSGSQALEALRSEGIETVLINSNPATIMTDKEMADKIYIEPINIDFIEKIIQREKPDSILAAMGGQTGLNMAMELHDKGILEKYNVEVIGTGIDAIKKGEDRDEFRKTMKKINQPLVESEIVNNFEDGIKMAKKIGFPLVVRPAYTLGGTGGGFANNEEELEEILKHGIALSPVSQVLLEKSIKGYMEIEFEVIRDAKGNSLIVCDMENIDPVGVHTGDSIVVAPCQSLKKEIVDKLKRASIEIVNEVGVEGACNVQLALNPKTYDYYVIEINPRVSRSSALASKATGYPIAKVATKIAAGLNLDEIMGPNGKSLLGFAPSPNYVALKFPKWPFDKFKFAKRKLGTKMMATGEVMAIGANFEEALLKGIRSLEIKKYSLENEFSKGKSLEELKKRIEFADDERIFDIGEILRRGFKSEDVEKITGIVPYFIEKIKWIVDKEEELKNKKLEDLDSSYLREIKEHGFSDKAIANFLGVREDQVRELRKKYNILPSYVAVDTSYFKAQKSYYYSSFKKSEDIVITDEKKVVVLGAGPIRIGQGIEFDYASVHAIKSLKNSKVKTIIINNNPETVSTDFDISDRLYFEPLIEEDVLNILEIEKPYGVILQFGGQTAIKLAEFLDKKGIKILGTDFNNIDRAEDRERFEDLLNDLKINRPKGGAVWEVGEGLELAEKLKYPLLIRPSYVLGGQGMEITHDENQLKRYLDAAFKRDKENPVLIDKYLLGREIEIDAICDGEDVLIPGIMEHLERAGVHSGDSISIYPALDLSDEIKDKILDYTKKIARGLEALGMINIQFIEYKDDLYIIEVNPRASRTVPYISKVTGIPIIDIATRVIMGEKLKDMPYETGLYKEAKLFAIKVPVFSMSKLARVEISLGPEMKSTGEVLGIGKDISEALYKGFLASGRDMLEEDKKVLATINDNDKKEFLEIAREMDKLGYSFTATEGTYKLLKENNISCTKVNRISEPHPNILDLIENNKVDLIINTPTRAGDSKRDGFKIRRLATEFNIDIFTSLDTIDALIKVKSKGYEGNKLNIYELSELA